MKFKILVINVLTVLTWSAAVAQNPNRFEIEADPIAYIFNGYSFHVGYNVGHVRFDAGAFGITQPSFFTSNDRFKVKSSGFGIKADYIFKGQKGFFLGLQSDYATDKIRLKENGELQKNDGVTGGIRGGYRFMFGKSERNFKGLYLVPWIAFMYNHEAKMLSFGSEPYRVAKWSVFPTIHLGYRF